MWSGRQRQAPTPLSKDRPSSRRSACQMVRPEGFEPPTFWSVARHSIQLSYGRTVMQRLQSRPPREPSERGTGAPCDLLKPPVLVAPKEAYLPPPASWARPVAAASVVAAAGSVLPVPVPRP
jgi:hypothetical protein